ncbi:unnamed protein product [Moneuplotes crassus]|uniref:Uncharacterized protein n=2 Tax=Euplotes crassus TaxID=5936 RepID=A0AAD1Y2R3_EUPCR|nr:unnamed protein product [Moneuplotes crassus]
MSKKPGKPHELTTTIQIEAWRQRLNTENRTMKDRDMKEIERLQAELDGKNTYFNIYKKDEVKKKEQEDEDAKEELGYDMTHEQEAPENKTWMKRKYGSQWAPERERKPAQETQFIPSTSSQEYGWREPLDTFQFGYNKSGICQRTFNDGSHLS